MFFNIYYMKNIENYKLFEAKTNYTSILSSKKEELKNKIEQNDIVFDVLDELNSLFDVTSHKGNVEYSLNIVSEETEFILALSSGRSNIVDISDFNYKNRFKFNEWYRSDAAIRRIDKLYSMENEGKQIYLRILIHFNNRYEFDKNISNALESVNKTLNPMGFYVKLVNDSYYTILDEHNRIFNKIEVSGIPIVLGGEDIIDRSYREGLPKKMIKDFEAFCRDNKLKQEQVTRLASIIKNGLE